MSDIIGMPSAAPIPDVRTPERGNRSGDGEGHRFSFGAHARGEKKKKAKNQSSNAVEVTLSSDAIEGDDTAPVATSPKASAYSRSGRVSSKQIDNHSQHDDGSVEHEHAGHQFPKQRSDESGEGE